MKEILFYEDNKKLKKLILTLAIIFSVCIAGWIIAFVLTFVIPPPADFEEIIENATSEIIEVIVFICIFIIITSTLYIYRFKSKVLKYYTLINKDEIILNLPSGIKKYEAKTLTEFEVVENKRKHSKLLIKFDNNEQFITTTSKLYELKTALNYLLLLNKSQKK